MSIWRCVAMVGAVLLAIVDVTDCTAQSVPTIGYVAARNASPKRLEVFKQGLEELGYIEEKNIHIEYREAVLDAEYHGVMADLVNRKFNLIVAANVAATVAAAKATSAIPIVMLAVYDPVGVGVVRSLERPGTNVTGTTMYAPQLIGERLQMLRRIVPDLDRVAMALNGNNANNAAQFELLRSEAQKLGIEFVRWTFASLTMSMQRLTRPRPSALRRSSTRLTPSSTPGASRWRSARRNTNCRSSIPTSNTSRRAD